MSKVSSPVVAQHTVLVRPRLYLGDAISIGPGKIDLLLAIERERSISAAARVMGMPYKRAWLLMDSLNQGFGEPVVQTSAGGKGGGGAALTPLGQRLIAAYQTLESRINEQVSAELRAFAELTLQRER